MKIKNKQYYINEGAFLYKPENNRLTYSGRQNDVMALYEILFNETDLFKCNELIQSFLNTNLSSAEGLNQIKNFLNDSAVFDLDPSLIQSVLLFTSHLEETKNITEKLAEKIDTIIASNR